MPFSDLTGSIFVEADRLIVTGGVRNPGTSNE